MSLRINHNISSINTHRNLAMNSQDLGRSLERLSSGLKINRAADGPASLVISEQMRAQIAGLDQAVSNSETAVSMVQTTEAALSEVNNLLVNVRQLAIHASNEGANDDVMLAADQQEVSNSLENLDRIARSTQFGTVNILDGSNSANGVATGEGVEFVSATTETSGSGPDGYDIIVRQNASKARIMGETALNQDQVQAGETFKILEGGKVVSYTTSSRDTVKTAVQNLQSTIDDAGLKVDVSLDESGRLVMEHREYGSEQSFKASSTSQGVISSDPGEFKNSIDGKDIEGTINGESATGSGQLLEGKDGADTISGLKVRFTGQADLRDRAINGDLMGINGGVVGVDQEGNAVEVTGDGEEIILGNFNQQDEIIINRTDSGAPIRATKADLRDLSEVSSAAGDLKDSDGMIQKNEELTQQIGNVHVAQNSVKFQIGGNVGQNVGVSLLDVSARALAKGVVNDTGYRNLGEIDVTTFQGAQDAITMVDKAINEVSAQRARLGAIQKNNLESNIKNLKVAHESLTSAESVLRDADMAAEMATFTRNQIMTQSATAMLAQSNNVPKNVLQLLNG